MAVCYGLWEKEARPCGVFVINRQYIRKSWNDISVSNLNKDDGLDKSLYAKNTNTLAFMAYDKFENFRRYDLNIVDYINKYERWNNQIKHIDMV